ncbi:hypothetical protein [Chitinophaga sp. HK235]|uniref:hypothetical protein n=1 Tax=Chitinophaga sp. HK235 TaxID=2952571 RepID=UPI001BAD0C9C|nr:hypothetical protein [Chitinophaga sp. HK235]
MLIVFGFRNMPIKSERVNHINCPTCGSQNLFGTAHRRYFHVYWIPVFSVGPTDIELKCESCHEDLYSEEVHVKWDQFKYYWYTFIGLYLIGALLLYFMLGTMLR